MKASLDGKVVLITGAARGIGAELAKRLAAQGAKLALVGLEPERLAELASQLGEGHLACEADVTVQATLEAAVARAVSHFGGLDVVVANAGIANNGTVAVNPPDALARTIEVNLIGVMRTVSATLPAICERRGYFLLISSAAALVALPGMAAYSASKIGVEHFGAALRLEVLHRGVEVGVAHPGWIDTDLVKDQDRELPTFRALLQRLPGPFGTRTSVEGCAEALTGAIQRRARKVYVPRSLGWIAPLRTLIWSGLVQRRMARDAAASVPKLEDEVRALGRAFGQSSVGHAARKEPASGR